MPVLITLVTVALAVPLAWAMWGVYMGAPWTRDGTVRVYVVTMAPEMAGRIVGLPVADNQFVHKGDLLMMIDPRDYRIAVSRTEAAVQQAQANARNAEIQSQRRMRWPDGQIGPRMAWQPPSGPVTPRRHSKRRARWHGMGE